MTAGGIIIAIMVILFVLSIALNGLYAGYETGFLSCNPVRVRHMADREQHHSAKSLRDYLDRPDRLLTVVLLGTNISLVFGTLVITRLAGPGWATLIATPLFLIFGEIVPKSMFRAHPTRSSLAFLPAIRGTDWLLAPVAAPVMWFSRGILSLVHGREFQGMHLMMHSSEDVRVLIDVSASHGAIEEEEKEMIHSVMDLQVRSAKEVMVPRIEMQALPESATRTELLKLLNESGRTRIPIYGENIDEVVGVVNAFDLLRDTQPEDEDIHRLIRPVLHVHDTMKLDDVLKAMRDARQSMAIVNDEYGGTDGLVTLEDILEEIFGEIQDEYDVEEAPIRRMGPHDFVVMARTPLEEVAEAMGTVLEDEEVETIGGWLMHAAGRIPQKGEVVRHGDFRVTVLDGSHNAVSRIRIEILSGKQVDDGEQT